MRTASMLLAVLLVSSPDAGLAGDPPSASAPAPAPAASADKRVPVQVTPEESLRQKFEMRENLVALRDTLARLAESDFAGVEQAVRRLAHPGPVSARPGVSVAVFADLERQFEGSVDKTVEAARSGNSQTVLRALSDTMAYCQSCHMAFRQAEVPGSDGKAP
ncbi:MAG: hypothetical protein ABR538_15920 [Candidatus Binatia bacterium]